MDEEGFLITTIAKQSGVKYLVQTAGILDAAAFSTATTTVLVNSPSTLTVHDNFRLGSAFSRYLRVNVTAAP